MAAVEVTNISSSGIWLDVHGRQLFLSYDEFPWFRDAPVADILNVEERLAGCFYWPRLDVDLSVGVIERVGEYPLRAK